MPLFEAAGKLASRGTRDVRDELSALLLDNFTRVKDLFAAWDENTDGLVSRQEFIRACQELGLDASAEEAGGLFDEFDVNGSGQLDQVELHGLLRQGRKVSLAQNLQAGFHGAMPELSKGAEGEIELEAKLKGAAIRKAANERGARFTEAFGEIKVAEVPAKLKEMLDQRHERLRDVFNEWDLDRDGNLDRHEFAVGLKRLGLELGDDDARWLFGVFDTDGTGSIDAAEFAHAVHSARSAQQLAELQRRTLRNQTTRGHAQSARVRELQGAAAKAEAAALVARRDAGETLEAAEASRVADVAAAEELLQLELLLEQGRVLDPPQIRRYRALAARLCPRPPPAVARRRRRRRATRSLGHSLGGSSGRRATSRQR